MNLGVRKTVIHGQPFDIVMVFTQARRCTNKITQTQAPSCNKKLEIHEIAG